MFSGVTLNAADVTSALVSFMGIGAVTAVLAAVIALKMAPKVFGAIRSLVGRR